MKDEVLHLWTGGGNTNNTTNNNNNDNNNNNNNDDCYLIDGTVGLGGHSLGAIEKGAKILGIDRDPHAIQMAKRRFDAALESEGDAAKIKEEHDDDNDHDANDVENLPYVLHHGSYADILPALLQQYSFPAEVHGILLDLGVNSYQLDNEHRGFTFRRHGPLDMRYNVDFGSSKGSQVKAREIINTYTVDELTSIFERYSDEPHSHVIAEAIVKWRNDKKKERGMQHLVKSTLELRYIIEEAMVHYKESTRTDNPLRITQQLGMGASFKPKPHKPPAEDKFENFRKIWRHHRGDAMKKTKARLKKQQLYEKQKVKYADHVMRCFQALRIETNDELKQLESVLSTKEKNSNGIGDALRLGGRLVVIAFHPGEDEMTKVGMDEMVRTGDFRLLTPEEEGLRPTEEEVKANGRARTARLRAVEKIR